MWARTLLSAFLTSQSISNLLRGQSTDTNDFIAAALTGSNSNGGARHLQKICKEFEAGLIGLAFHRRSGEGDLQGVSQLSCDGTLPRARVDFDRERCAQCAFMDWNHGNEQSF